MHLGEEPLYSGLAALLAAGLMQMAIEIGPVPGLPAPGLFVVLDGMPQAVDVADQVAGELLRGLPRGLMAYLDLDLSKLFCGRLGVRELGGISKLQLHVGDSALVLNRPRLLEEIGSPQ